MVELVQAFLEQRTWSQADLARRLEMTTPAVRDKLKELQPVFGLECQKDHPHVYWSVPKNWFPGGVIFKREQLPDLLRLLLRMAQGKARDAVLDTILKNLPREERDGDLAATVVSPAAVASEDAYLSVVEDAARKKTALRLRYFTASRGDVATRHASVHRVVTERPARFIATCHRDGTLKWFRVENMFAAELDPHQEYRAATKQTVDAFHRASTGGFNAGGTPELHTFVVRPPEARWVQNNLLSNMTHEPISQSRIRVSVETNAIQQVARFVVGLGAAATAETPALASAVAELARGALDANDGTGSRDA